MDNFCLIYFLPAMVADLIWGDSFGGKWHPVILIGKLIGFFEDGLYPSCREEGLEFKRGLVTVLLTLSATGLGVGGILFIGTCSGFMWISLITFFLLYTLLACGGLAREAQRVLRALEDDGLEAGRLALSRIVGRETAELGENDIYKAVIETVAENFSDGVVAPVFYLILGGLPLAWIYKAVNTLDSMLGYRNERYLYFGRPAARLDDLANWLPARITAILILAAGFMSGRDWRAGWRILKRDHDAHLSPNSGWPEAAMAGLIGVRLGGSNIYHGNLIDKPHIGDVREPLSSSKVRESIVVLYLGTGLLAALTLVIALIRITMY